MTALVDLHTQDLERLVEPRRWQAARRQASASLRRWRLDLVEPPQAARPAVRAQSPPSSGAPAVLSGALSPYRLMT